MFGRREIYKIEARWLEIKCIFFFVPLKQTFPSPVLEISFFLWTMIIQARCGPFRTQRGTGSTLGELRRFLASEGGDASSKDGNIWIRIAQSAFILHVCLT